MGVGGGATLDTAKAAANLLTNGGKAEEYQGWDLVKKPGVYKIALPTLSGTGAEATRTCVMTNKRTGLKLGMNSDYTVYDQVIFRSRPDGYSSQGSVLLDRDGRLHSLHRIAFRPLS